MYIEAGGLVYNPYLVLDDQISATSKHLARAFDDIDRALDKGKSVGKAVRGVELAQGLRGKLAGARLLGFTQAAQYSKAKMPVLYGDKIRKAANRRALKVNDWMTESTKRMLKTTPDSAHVLSTERALNAARFENARAYFSGVRDAYDGTNFRKKWITGLDPCDSCIDNEDQGRIHIAEAFGSGDMFPPGHLSCLCWLVITR